MGFEMDGERGDVRETILFRLSRAYRSLRRLMEADQERYGAYEGRDLVLIEILRRGERARPSRIAAALGMGRSSVSAILRRSEHAGYTTREADPSDGRSFVVGLTHTGRISARLLMEAWLVNERVVMRGLEPGERRELARLLDTVQERLDALDPHAVRRRSRRARG